MNRVPLSPFAALVAGLLVVGSAQAEVAVTITGNVAVAEIALPDAQAPLYTATLRLEFTAPENLTVGNLGIEAQIIDPALLLPRLPGSTSVPAEFPVLVRVEPPPGVQMFASSFEGGEFGADDLAFRNAVSMELRTVDLPFDKNRPLRLLRAPLAGNFEDITSNVLPGSARARARSGGFSEFVIVDDQRPLQDQALDRFTRLDVQLADPAIEPATAAALVAAMAQCRLKFDSSDYDEALLALAAFDALLEAATPEQVPNRWRARRDLSNPRGEIESLSTGLAFRLQELEDDDK